MIDRLNCLICSSLPTIFLCVPKQKGFVGSPLYDCRPVSLQESWGGDRQVRHYHRINQYSYELGIGAGPGLGMGWARAQQTPHRGWDWGQTMLSMGLASADTHMIHDAGLVAELRELSY